MIKKIFKIILPKKMVLFIRNLRIKLKKQYTLNLVSKLDRIVQCNNSPKYIVSLTSYGRRLKETVAYTIITLLNQTVKPDKVVLWVANEDKDLIPDILFKLKEKGLEIYFCEDIRSYKKLIPSLEMFPNDFIITADDDVYYPKYWLEKLIVQHKKHPKKIICYRAHKIILDEKNYPAPYRNWVFWVKSYNQTDKLFPTGVGGILYPHGCFYKDITNRELFKQLAPYADDIWFWAMAVLNNNYFGNENPYIIIDNEKKNFLSYIEPEQNSTSSLWLYNSDGGNDKQLKAVIEKYPQIKDFLCNNK